VIEALRARGLWGGTASRFAVDSAAIAARAEAERRERQRKIALAMKTWIACSSIGGTMAEDYLRTHRGITIAMPDTLHFHPDLPHPSGKSYPAMVALVTDSENRPVAIHQTFLDPTTRNKIAEHAKLMFGPCSRAAVRLGKWKPGDTLLLSEGLETGLSGMQLSGNPCWSCLSTSGLKAVELPAAIRSVTVLVDVDANGAGEKAAQACASRLSLEGRTVRLARPPAGPAGYGDWNDILIKEVA